MFRGAKKRTFRFGKKNVSFPKVETFRFADYINIAGVYETEDFLLFFYGYKEKAYWMLCSKQDWMCKANNYEDCFTDDLSPSEEKFVCRSFTSVTQRHLISIREDKEGDANPTLLVAELK